MKLFTCSSWKVSRLFAKLSTPKSFAIKFWFIANIDRPKHNVGCWASLKPPARSKQPLMQPVGHYCDHYRSHCLLCPFVLLTCLLLILPFLSKCNDKKTRKAITILLGKTQAATIKLRNNKFLPENLPLHKQDELSNLCLDSNKLHNNNNNQENINSNNNNNNLSSVMRFTNREVEKKNSFCILTLWFMFQLVG